MKVFKIKNASLYGTIIEKGNSNSTKYFKFSDGTLIMTGTYNTGTITFGNANSKHVDFPVSFKDNLYYVGFTKSSGGSYGFSNVSDAVYKYKGSFDSVHWCPAGVSRVDPIDYCWIAIGEWK